MPQSRRMQLENALCQYVEMAQVMRHVMGRVSEVFSKSIRVCHHIRTFPIFIWCPTMAADDGLPTIAILGSAESKTAKMEADKWQNHLACTQ